MKKIYSLLLSIFFTLNLLAQNVPAAKTDVIIKLNGEEMKGKVTKVSTDDLTFVYDGETLEYTLKNLTSIK